MRYVFLEYPLTKVIRSEYVQIVVHNSKDIRFSVQDNKWINKNLAKSDTANFCDISAKSVKSILKKIARWKLPKGSSVRVYSIYSKEEFAIRII